ncbi:MAG: ABC transporter permease [Pseudotabrizicola sp.]|uniref:ABC transporter permease n=1 Tax=Pseudotabrizicola sp. TaxID=2939647 RepID=UPI0027316079|nr:ABC transporter permease [Pseudotabrizicola sp.]MDP2082537.1 ABC transporter permease [Pseudotabrizicola sp.]MDZ7573952.1 ABC transporter permease [Pseudotabrizicola sp.]
MSLLKSREALLALAILLLIGVVAARFPAFVRPANLANVLNDTSPLIILAIGQMIVILTKCIDLSVAANLALCGMVAALMNGAGVPLPLILMGVVALGAGLGAVNGVLVWKLGIPSIVVTLGTMTIFRGTIFLITDGKWVNAHQMSDGFKALPRTVLLGLPVMSWMAIALIILFTVVLTRTALGRSFYAVGGNPHAAVYAGINVGRTQFSAFVISGALAGLAGYLWVARYAVAYVDIAGGFELDVVAACVIGGVAIAGGAGTVAGAVLGALFLGVIKNALPVVGISPFWQMAISGAAIVLAVTFNATQARAPGRIILKSAEAR